MAIGLLSDTEQNVLDGKLSGMFEIIRPAAGVTLADQAQRAREIVESVEGKLVRSGWLQRWEEHHDVLSGWFSLGRRIAEPRPLNAEEAAKQALKRAADRAAIAQNQALFDVFKQLIALVAYAAAPEEKVVPPPGLEKALRRYLGLRGFRLLPAFTPNALQEAVLKALDGKALKLVKLVKLVKRDRVHLLRCMKPLRERGLIKNDRHIGGYYRPDAPPPK